MATNDDIMKLLLEIKVDVNNGKQALSSVAADISGLKEVNENLSSSLEDCIQKYNEMKKENRQLKKRLVQTESAIHYLVRKDKEKNIVMFGIEETDNEDLTNIVINVFDTIDVHLKKEDICSIKRLGINPGLRPLLIVFKEVHFKSLIFKNVMKFKDRKIFVNNDLTKEQRNENKRIRERLFECKQKLDSIGKNSQVRNTKSLCENKFYDEHSAFEFIRSLNLNEDKERKYESDNSDSIKTSVSTIASGNRKRGRPEGSKNRPIKLIKLKKCKKSSSIPASGNLKDFFQKESTDSMETKATPDV